MRTMVFSDVRRDAVTDKLRDVFLTLTGWRDPVIATFDDAERSFFQTDVEVTFVCLSNRPERGLDVIRRLRESTSTKILAVGQVNDPKLILRALQNGANHYLDEAELETQLEAGLSRLVFQHEGGAPTGRLLAVLSASGGCGASTLAVNIAAVLAKEHGKCNLIDLNSEGGDLATFLNLRPQFTLADLCLNEARLDQAMYEQMLLRHDATGILLLASPSPFNDTRVVSARGVRQAVILARRLFAEVVVDLEDCYHEEQVATLCQASGAFLICRLDFASLRNARLILEHIKKIGIARSRIKLVINQYGLRGELPVHDAEEALGEKLMLFIPHDSRTIYSANNTGMPAVIRDPSSKVSQSLIKLARIAFEKRPLSSPTLPAVPQVTLA